MIAGLSGLTPAAGPAAGGNRVVVAAARGVALGRPWGLRFGSMVVPAHVHGPQGGPGAAGCWRLSCVLPPHPPGTVSVEAVLDGVVCTARSGLAYTFVEGRQWADLIGAVAAPSHARSCLLNADENAYSLVSSNEPTATRWWPGPGGGDGGPTA